MVHLLTLRRPSLACGPRSPPSPPPLAAARGSGLHCSGLGAGPAYGVMHMHEQRAAPLCPRSGRRRDGAGGGGPGAAGGAEGGLSAWSSTSRGPGRRGAGPGWLEVSGPSGRVRGKPRQVRRCGRWQVRAAAGVGAPGPVVEDPSPTCQARPASRVHRAGVRQGETSPEPLLGAGLEAVQPPEGCVASAASRAETGRLSPAATPRCGRGAHPPAPPPAQCKPTGPCQGARAGVVSLLGWRR